MKRQDRFEHDERYENTHTCTCCKHRCVWRDDEPCRGCSHLWDDFAYKPSFRMWCVSCGEYTYFSWRLHGYPGLDCFYCRHEFENTEAEMEAE